MNTCQIIHIPNKPPFPPNQQPTVNVFASVVEPKLANTIIRRLNQVAPLEDLRHVKRIQKKFLEGGKTQLSVILCLADENDHHMSSLPQDIQELVNSHQLSPFIAKVCRYAALSKEEWEEQCKLWPTSYHPPTYNIDGITGFSEEDSQSIFGFMKSAVKMAKSGDGSMVNAAIIVDPSVKHVIASACDQICSCSTSTKENSINGCSGQREVPHSSPSKDSPVVSCLSPSHWAQQKSHTASCYLHPLHHAAMVAIESSAARDRGLFPGVEHDRDKSNGVDNIHSASTGTPAKRQKTDFENVENGEEMDPSAEDFHPTSARPYLCTGYDIFLVWEPCVMCAMALIHQRIRRIFYAFPNQHAGALGSIHRLQDLPRMAQPQLSLSNEIGKKNPNTAEDYFTTQPYRAILNRIHPEIYQES